MSSTVHLATDAELADATALARRTFKYFWRELSWEFRRIVPAYDLACVKVAFAEGEAVEYMWVGEVGFDGEHLTGVLLNQPNEVANVQQGDRVRAPLADRLSDWMLAATEDQVLGGFTIQVLRARMDERSRAEHDEAWGFDFGDPEDVGVPPEGDDHPMAVNMGASLEKFLAEHPDQLDAVDEETGFTMLHREALAGNAEIVRILLAHGARAGVRSKNGKTALDLARILGWPKVEGLLLAAKG